MSPLSRHPQPSPLLHSRHLCLFTTSGYSHVLKDFAKIMFQKYFDQAMYHLLPCFLAWTSLKYFITLEVVCNLKVLDCDQRLPPVWSKDGCIRGLHFILPLCIPTCHLCCYTLTENSWRAFLLSVDKWCNLLEVRIGSPVGFVRIGQEGNHPQDERRWVTEEKLHLYVRLLERDASVSLHCLDGRLSGHCVHPFTCKWEIHAGLSLFLEVGISSVL